MSRTAHVLVPALAIAFSALGAACGHKETAKPPVREDARVGSAAALSLAAGIPELRLGAPDLASYAWRTRAGHEAFRTARKAEDRGDWAAVVTGCQQALAADPTHLEAAWLLAAALGHLGKHAELLAPLTTAVAGDFGRWAQASLELPALAGFRATPMGEAWTRRLAADRERYLAAIARSTIVNASGDLYAFDTQGPRWYRLTRTFGRVLGGLGVPSTRELAYVARVGTKGKRELAIGVVDLAKGTTVRPLPLGTPGPITVVYATKPAPGFWIGAGKPVVWRQLADARLRPLPAKSTRPAGRRLEVAGTSARLLALPVPTVTADWDDAGLASAIRIGTSNRVVSAPSPGLIDGNTATWAPGRSHLAFVAQLDETCAPGTLSSAAYLAEAATGKLTELERAAGGLAIEWVSERKLAIAGDRGVSIIDLDGGPTLLLEGAANLVAPRKRPQCTEPEPEPAPTEEPEGADPEVAEPPQGAANE